MPDPRIKDEKTYEALRREGAGKAKAARIANDSGGSRSKTGSKGGKSDKYERQSKQDLYSEAKKVGIEGRSSMTKEQLISALRKR
ncbi:MULTISPECIES: Rho termination factor N-terminal domain-containing protein [Streptomyces]|uniref:Rho termination factor n=1 Tax=Streptomyces lycii TaxID=2654337 RepID=A0ABQ7FC88_9ACTN|nr:MULTISPECIES: Rho termination factor N-terminal domain-containing protein [Streptomyces]KAF4406410.1 Rho termination factor [Streptomyces lycii]PGH51578.1 Rho termination factor [Streptomyces sp. Ru87]